MFAKKFIFSKFSGLETYSRQLYYQMNSFTSIFQQHFKPPPHAPPFIDLSPPPPHPHQILKSPPSPHLLNTCGKPCDHNFHQLHRRAVTAEDSPLHIEVNRKPLVSERKSLTTKLRVL